MTAYYSENDPFCCALLAELMADGLIAPGVIDNRSIVDVQASDLKGFTQVHMFAGGGCWSLAARLAGWPDSRSFWSASCPCPPFSTAGKVKACGQCGGLKPVPHVSRTGYFLCSLCGNEWSADGRHLWPEVWRLVRDGRPSCIVGEQVASGDGRTWLDLVRASLEILAYDAWGVDTCAAGHGAPHIRSRLYWMADTDSAIAEQLEGPRDAPGYPQGAGPHGELDGRGDRLWLANPNRSISGQGRENFSGRDRGSDEDARGRLGRSGGTGRLDKPERTRLEGFAGDGDGCGEAGNYIGATRHDGAIGNSAARIERPGPTNGLWRDVDWLGCTDGKWRPVESSPLALAHDGTVRDILAGGGRESDAFTFPLAEAGTYRNRVDELRMAGNAINVAQAAGFLRAIGPEARQ